MFIRSVLWSSVRLALNYKGIPFNTIWVEFPDIASVCKEMGVAPVPNSNIPHTFPVIYDPSTKAFISDSEAIARYLDEKFPNAPKLIPAETDTLHASFDAAFMSTLLLKWLYLFIPALNSQLSHKSQEYFRSTREAVFGKLEDMAPVGPVRDRRMKDLQDALSTIAKWHEMDGVPKKFVIGDKMCYADLTIAAFLLSLKKVLGENSEEWQAINNQWDRGRWGRLLSVVAKYE